MSFFQNSGLQLFESRSVLNRKLESVGFKRSKIGSKEQFRFRRSIPPGLWWVNKRIQHTLFEFLAGVEQQTQFDHPADPSAKLRERKIIKLACALTGSVGSRICSLEHIHNFPTQ